MTLFDQLCDRYHVKPDRKGECWITCPFCGKAAKHFSFGEQGCHCFACGQGGSLGKLAEQVGVDSPITAQPVVPKAQPIIPWLAEGVTLVNRLCAHPDRYRRWAAYKPLSRSTIDRHHFGLGRLPFQDKNGKWYWSPSEWLTVPLFENGALVGLRGRNLKPDGKPKWISATGTRYALWNIGNVRPGGVLWICENYVDAAWLMETHAAYNAVALGGAANWRDEWAQAVAAKKPQVVMVALDWDLAGQAQGRMYQQLLAEWRRQHPGLPDPTLNGLKIANSLWRLNVNACLFEYPPDAPAKADVGWLIAHEMRRAA